MKNQDERFWSEFSEDELKDPATRRTLEVLRAMYRSNEDDQQSVQRAWQRISSTMSQKSQEQNVARFDTLHEVPVPLSFAGIKNSAFAQSNKKKRRIEVIAALIIIFLLIGSTVGIFAHYRATSETVSRPQRPASKPIALPTVPANTAKLLGTRVGRFSLSADGSNSSVIGPVAYDDGRIYIVECGTCGYQVWSSVSEGQKKIIEIGRIVVWSPFSGSTAEGLHIGMSLKQFENLYKGYQMMIKKNPQVVPPAGSIGSLAHGLFTTSGYPVIDISYDSIALIENINGTVFEVMFSNGVVVGMIMQSRQFMKVAAI